MAALSIRDLDDGVRDRLRIRAAENGRSMEAEAREILSDAVAPRATKNIAMALREAAMAAGGVELEIPARTGNASYVDFSTDDFRVVGRGSER